MCFKSSASMAGRKPAKCVFFSLFSSANECRGGGLLTRLIYARFQELVTSGHMHALPTLLPGQWHAGLKAVKTILRRIFIKRDRAWKSYTKVCLQSTCPSLFCQQASFCADCKLLLLHKLLAAKGIAVTASMPCTTFAHAQPAIYSLHLEQEYEQNVQHTPLFY